MIHFQELLFFVRRAIHCQFQFKKTFILKRLGTHSILLKKKRLMYDFDLTLRVYPRLLISKEKHWVLAPNPEHQILICHSAKFNMLTIVDI